MTWIFLALHQTLGFPLIFTPLEANAVVEVMHTIEGKINIQSWCKMSVRENLTMFHIVQKFIFLHVRKAYFLAWLCLALNSHPLDFLTWLFATLTGNLMEGPGIRLLWMTLALNLGGYLGLDFPKSIKCSVTWLNICCDIYGQSWHAEYSHTVWKSAYCPWCLSGHVNTCN